MAGRSPPKRAKVRGKQPKAHFASELAEIVSETVRLWRKHHHVTLNVAVPCFNVRDPHLRSDVTIQ